VPFFFAGEELAGVQRMEPTTATSELTGTNADDNAAINALLSGESGEAAAASESEQDTGTTTEERETETAESEEQPTETAEAVEETEEVAEAEEAEEESELSIEESDRDYSDAAYKKAADHYSKTKGVQLNPDDPAHRALLKEVMDRGETLKRNRAELEAAKSKTAEEAKATEEVATTTEPVKLTPEQLQANIDIFENVAKARIVPQVALHVASRFVRALWPGEKIEMTQEQANDFTSALHSFFLMAIEDISPQINGMVNQNLATDPVWGPARDEAIEARAFEHLDKTKGAEWFASMETLVDNGTLKKVIADNPQIFKNMRVDKDPVLNHAAKLELAYKIARGDQTVQQVMRAVETGKKQATDNAKKIASGRVVAGTPKSGFNKSPSGAQDLVNSITQGGGSRFSQAVKTQLRK
jgi:hypothetical protein